jgi:hypothetical protein
MRPTPIYRKLVCAARPTGEAKNSLRRIRARHGVARTNSFKAHASSRLLRRILFAAAPHSAANFRLNARIRGYMKRKNVVTAAVAASILMSGSNAPVQAQDTSTFPAPKNTGDPATVGLGIQRTMTLLAESTSQKRKTVRVLFYGQSITEGAWWKSVADDLKTRFPHANLIIENRALGGYSSQRLIHTAESDLYSFYPDLMIFHVYGSHLDYESIIRRTRERTTSEILLQTDHANQEENLTEETDPMKLGGMRPWDSFMNYVFLPGIAKKYNTGVVDQRNLWKQYLRDHNLKPQQLLNDGVHPNAHGNYLMAELTKAYLVRRPEIQIDPYNSETVKTLVVGKDVQWQNGKLVSAIQRQPSGCDCQRRHSPTRANSN